MQTQSNSESRKKTASETVAIIENGQFVTPSGKVIRIEKEIQESVTYSKLIRPAEMADYYEKARQMAEQTGRPAQLKIHVANETTFAAAQRMRAKGPVLALNFASARNPGGGFLSGASAQEEALCRGSALYPTLIAHPDYYSANRKERSCLYTDHIIFSPEVPVFRNDQDELLEKFYSVSFITAPAPNRGAIEQNAPKEVKKIEEVFLQRIEQVLAIAVAEGYHRLVLGAWGCGAFRNKTEDVARWFHHHLTANPLFKGMLSEVNFAVLDHSKEERFVGPFRKQFGE